jgi:hypothetical protein
MNACVGENGGPYDFYDYAWGYFEASHAAVRAALDHEAPVDVLVYPICFGYRHAIELSLKHLAHELPKLWKAAGTIKLNHLLYDTWEVVKEYLQRSPHFDPDGDLIPFVDRVLKDFLEFDQDGTVFRFPLDRKGNLHLQDARIINVVVLGEVMAKVQEAFKHWDRIRRVIEAHGEYMEPRGPKDPPNDGPEQLA